jgi:hypothetical protein
LEQPEITFDDLEHPNLTFNELITQIDCQMAHKAWQDYHQSITMMRILNRYFTLDFSFVFPKYVDFLQDLLNNGKTQITKNILRLIG